MNETYTLCNMTAIVAPKTVVSFTAVTIDVYCALRPFTDVDFSNLLE